MHSALSPFTHERRLTGNEGVDSERTQLILEDCGPGWSRRGTSWRRWAHPVL